MNSTRPEFMEAEPASYETPEFTLDDLEAAFRRVLGNDTVDRINNPVGMALEDAARREKYNTPYENWNQPQRPWTPERVANPEDPVQQDLLRDRRFNHDECEMCPATDFAPHSVLCRDCQHGIEKQDPDRCECGREVHWTDTCRFCLKEKLSKELDLCDEVEWPFEDIQVMFRDFKQLDEFIGNQTQRVEPEHTIQPTPHSVQWVRSRIRFGLGCEECLQQRANGKKPGFKRSRDHGCVACQHDENPQDSDFGATSGGGCLGCGAEGYDNDWCSRDCMRMGY